jgi:hypothetical protein
MGFRPIVKQNLPKDFTSILIDEMIQLDQVDALARNDAVNDDSGPDTGRNQKQPRS